MCDEGEEGKIGKTGKKRRRRIKAEMGDDMIDQWKLQEKKGGVGEISDHHRKSEKLRGDSQIRKENYPCLFPHNLFI